MKNKFTLDYSTNKYTYPMSAWTYNLNADNWTEDDIKDWIDCGLNMILSPKFDPELHSKDNFIRLLKTCEKYHFKLVLQDNRVHLKGASKNPEKYREIFKTAYEEFGHYKSVYGFFLGDEPQGEEAINDLITALTIQKEIAPELKPFFNCTGYNESVQKWMDEKMPDGLLDQICYCQYIQMIVKPEINFRELDIYFQNLRLYKAIADKKGVPLMTCLISTGHMAYLPVDEDSIRWQLYTALACGCKGVWWFTLYGFLGNVNYRKAPINIFGERTQVYEDLSLVIREFHLLYEDLFLKLDLQKVYCIGKIFGNYPAYSDGCNDILISFKNSYLQDFLVSFYKDENGVDYMAIVNNSYKEVAFPNMTFAKSAGKLYKYNAQREPVCLYERFCDETVIENKDSWTVSTYLGPGQMVLYKFVK